MLTDPSLYLDMLRMIGAAALTCVRCGHASTPLAHVLTASSPLLISRGFAWGSYHLTASSSCKMTMERGFAVSLGLYHTSHHIIIGLVPKANTLLQGKPVLKHSTYIALLTLHC
jgi:hypothetical protein